MKKFGILGITLLSVVVLGACSSTSSNSSSESATVAKIDEKNLDGSYYSDKNYSGDVATIEIDGKDILFTALGNSQVGTIDTSKKTIKFKNEKATYKIIGNKLVLTYGENGENGSISFTKGTPPKSKSASSSSSSTSSNSSSTKSSSSSSSSNSATSSSVEGEKVYSDSYIEVTKKGGIVTFKNIFSEDITVDGKAYLNNTNDINIFSFGYVGSIKTGGVETENITKVYLNDKSEDYILQSGDTITYTATIRNKDYAELTQISFEFKY